MANIASTKKELPVEVGFLDLIHVRHNNVSLLLYTRTRINAHTTKCRKDATLRKVKTWKQKTRTHLSGHSHKRKILQHFTTNRARTHDEVVGTLCRVLQRAPDYRNLVIVARILRAELSPVDVCGETLEKKSGGVWEEGRNSDKKKQVRNSTSS